MKCYIFDIDGTLADLTHRLHHIQKQPKDWDAFFAACPGDELIRHMRDLMADLYCSSYPQGDVLSDYRSHHIVCASGRSEVVREATEEWLGRNYCPHDALYMRKAGDHRPDDIVKGEIYEQIIADGYEPVMAFDDRARVVDMWRKLGVPCAQVAEGDF